LPRWRGFNLFEMFHPAWTTGEFVEHDFDLVREWGFDFVRLPCSYWFWAKPEAPADIDEKPLAAIDRAIAWGRARGVHVNLCLHRIPGYCINPPAEPASLFEDEPTLEVACRHWRLLAQRYRGIPNHELTFDLMNEPPHVSDDTYLRVHGALASAIRGVDPQRLIIADGKGGGHLPVAGVAALGRAMSTRGYSPFRVSHHQAAWVKGADAWPSPSWPLCEQLATSEVIWDKQRLYEDRILPWQAVERTGVGIHIGEWGAHNRTPHAVTLAWMRDNLELFKAAGWGWALWNIRGNFGVMDSKRSDVAYERYQGHELDRKMLELLREY
jgi:endoglucanase